MIFRPRSAPQLSDDNLISQIIELTDELNSQESENYSVKVNQFSNTQSSNFESINFESSNDESGNSESQDNVYFDQAFQVQLFFIDFNYNGYNDKNAGQVPTTYPSFCEIPDWLKNCLTNISLAQTLQICLLCITYIDI